MRMELIQPFINAADAVLSETLQSTAKIGDVSMEEETYRRRGVVNALIRTSTLAKIAGHFAGGEVEATDEIVRETVCELANQVIGNAVTTLNDQGVRFKISPPALHTDEKGMASSEDTEALVMCFETPNGSVFMNIAMRYNRRRRAERAAAI